MNTSFLENAFKDILIANRPLLIFAPLTVCYLLQQSRCLP